MKKPKAFCVECNEAQSLTIRKHKTYPMYHCRNCGAEIGRVGDGLEAHAVQRIKNLDVASIPEDAREGMNLLDLARANPDVLSDEHRLWQPSEIPWEQKALDWQRAVAFALLTPRQREVANAVQQHNGQEAAAKALGVTQQAVSKIMHQIRKKLLADGCILNKKPLKGK
jgi:predicted RNA-binding Zn-ribbon protein involved in translation (DUF1610 family)